MAASDLDNFHNPGLYTCNITIDAVHFSLLTITLTNTYTSDSQKVILLLQVNEQ